jgi:hypothetical protein
MSISFKRNDVQVYVENAQNCFELEKWGSYKNVFINWEIGENDIIPLVNCVNSDATSYFFKAFESFIQALIDIHKDKQSWAIVKLYYSLFYLLRCDILLSNHILVRNSGLYFSRMLKNEKFIQFKKGKLRGDHQLTIAFVKDLHLQGKIVDPILDNKIDDNDAYTWFMLNRERINYSQKNFSEPDIDICFGHFYDYFKQRKVLELFEFYNSKDYSICFDLDHSILSIPYKKLVQVLKKGNGKIDFSGIYSRKLVFYLSELSEYGIDRKELLKLINQ